MTPMVPPMARTANVALATPATERQSVLLLGLLVALLGSGGGDQIGVNTRVGLFVFHGRGDIEGGLEAFVGLGGAVGRIVGRKRHYGMVSKLFPPREIFAFNSLHRLSVSFRGAANGGGLRSAWKCLADVQILWLR